MNVKLIVTKTCSHCSNLKRELDDIGVRYKVVYIEDNPEFVADNNIRHSPNIMVDNEIVCRGQVTESELKKLLNIN